MSEIPSENEPSASRPINGWLWLAVVLLACLPCFAWYGYGQHGLLGIGCAVVAAAVNFAAGSIALWFVPKPQQAIDGLSGLLLGIIFRTGIPLVAGVMLSGVSSPLAETSIFGMIMTYYLVALAAETTIAVRMIQHKPSLPKVF